MPDRAINAARNDLAFRVGRRLQALAAATCARLLRWHELSRQRRALLALNHRMLKDIGITRAEAEREARRPFWHDGIDLRHGAHASSSERTTADCASRISGYPRR